MDQETVNKLVSENMKNIFGFSISRMRSEHEAEELTSNIIYKVLLSAAKIHDGSKFFAYMWRIAENTYFDYLRGKKKNQWEEIPESANDESRSIQDEIIIREEINLLHRELSLLTDQYRQCIVLYYVENFTCSQIAERQKISMEMVKYYLFRARKIVREGMNMDRTFGEKSYNPKYFEIDFWGTKAGDDAEYRSFRERKIRGNILLAAYYSPITIQELSIELGVAVTYLEDEVCLLEKRQYLICKNGKYITNIPIFTIECKNEINKRISSAVKSAADKLICSFNNEFKKQFGDRFENEILLRWQTVMFYCHFSMLRTDAEIVEKYGEYPDDGPYSYVNGGGGAGFVWGRCMSTVDEDRHDFEGIYNNCSAQDGRGSVIAFNFKQITNGQHFTLHMTDPVSCTGVGCFDYLPEDCKKWMSELSYVKNGKPNFAVYSDEEYNSLSEILKNGIDIFTRLNRETFTIAAQISADHAPEHIRKCAEHVGSFVYQFNSLGLIAAELYNMGWLKNINDMDKPAICVIKHLK